MSAPKTPMPTNKPEVVLPELPELISSLQSMRDRMMAALPAKFGDGFDGDFDVLLEAINTLKRLAAYGQARYEAGRAAQAKHHQQQVGHLPSDAVAWLDMGKGEAQLMFGKRDASNRANKRQLAMLFEKVNPGYHPLYLHPQSADTLTRPVAGDFVMVPRHLAEMGVTVAEEWLQLFAETTGLEKYERFNYGPAVELFRDELSNLLHTGAEPTPSAAPQQHGQEVGGDFRECPHCKGWSRTPPPAIDIGKLRELVAELRESEDRAAADAANANEDRDAYAHDFEREAYKDCADQLAALIGDGGEC